MKVIHPDWVDDTAHRLTEPAVALLNAVLAFDHDVLRRQAEAGVSGGLAGMAIAVKDNICTLEYPTTCASRILQGYQSPYEATAVTRLKEAGAVVACKTNLDEFAMGSSTEHSAFGRCLHPTEANRVPGGSSGGSAALVAAGAVPAALGSETGGSVRQPAAFCGVVGFKPSYGRVSRFGLVAFGSSLDQIGVLGCGVPEVAKVVAAISGRDANDSTCQDVGPIQATLQRPNLQGLVIGLPDEYFPDDLHPAVRAACHRVASALREAGAVVEPVSLPHAGLTVPTYYVIAPAEASSNLARYDGVRYGFRETVDDEVRQLYRATRGIGFGAEVRRRIIVGTYVLSAGYYKAFYRRAQIARGLIAGDFSDVFSRGVDLVFTPTTAGPAFEAGEKLKDPVAMYWADKFVCAANLAGVPAISIPVGRTEGLPLGGQFVGPVNGDEMLLDVAGVVAGLVDPHQEIR